jgi:hypothetical protein
MLAVVLAAIALVCVVGIILVLLEEGVRLVKTAERLRRENRRLRELVSRPPEVPSWAQPRLARKHPRSRSVREVRFLRRTEED